MKHRHQLIAAASLTLSVIIGVAIASMPATQQPPQDPPGKPGAQDHQAPHEMPPPPGEHHKWLEKLVGTWSVETEMTLPGEGMPPMKSTGTDTCKSLGGRWVLCELNAEMPGMGKMSALLSLGYNSETGKYQGTWIDTVHDHLWIYTGTLDAAPQSAKILTLEAEGPNMMDPAAGMTKYRDVIEFKTADHRTLTSSAHVDGKWVQFVKAEYRRVK